MNMGARKTTILVIIVTAILLTVQVSAVAGAGHDDKEPELEMRVHYLYKADAKPDKPDKPDKPGGGKPGGDDGTYKLLGKGVLWKNLPITVHIDSDISPSFAAAIWEGADAWEDATAETLFNDPDTDTDVEWTSNGENEIIFGDYPTAGVIAVTYIWGYFGGPPKGREIVEFDIMFDDTDFDWGTDGSADVMDVWNIAIHELGHGLGLADLYDDADYQETMYGYASNGETIKRDLYKGDIAGIQSLYGAPEA